MQDIADITHVEGRGGLRGKLLNLGVECRAERAAGRIDSSHVRRSVHCRRCLSVARRGVSLIRELAPPGVDGMRASRRAFSASLRAAVIRV